MIDWSVVATIAAPIIALVVGAGLNHVLEAPEKLVCFLSHASAFTLARGDPNETTIHTHAVIVRNTGRKPATNIRIGHNTLPRDFEIHPGTEYQIVDTSDGGKDIVIPVIVPSEQYTISYVYFPPLTYHLVNTHIKSDQGLARTITVLPTPQLGRAARVLILALLMVGVIALLYGALEIALWLIGLLSTT